MTAKNLITLLLLVFVAGSLIYMVTQKESAANETIREETSSNTPQTRSQQASDEPKVIVYYFHGDMRCPTCHKLENYAEETLETHFADALESGKIQWKPVNTDRVQNEHFIEDYQLVTKSIILSRQDAGGQTEWKNLDEIWDRVGDKADYMNYIKTSIKQFIQKDAS